MMLIVVSVRPRIYKTSESFFPPILYSLNRLSVGVIVQLYVWGGTPRMQDFTGGRALL
jgi:hypothetical protein